MCLQSFLISQQIVVAVYYSGCFYATNLQFFFGYIRVIMKKICFQRIEKPFFIKTIGAESVLLNTSVYLPTLKPEKHMR